MFEPLFRTLSSTSRTKNMKCMKSLPISLLSAFLPFYLTSCPCSACRQSSVPAYSSRLHSFKSLQSQLPGSALLALPWIMQHHAAISCTLARNENHDSDDERPMPSKELRNQRMLINATQSKEPWTLPTSRQLRNANSCDFQIFDAIAGLSAVFSSLRSPSNTTGNVVEIA